MFVKKSVQTFTCRQVAWLRWVLLCTAFSALHGLLGAWVVPAVASGPVTEICTPSGMQWVAVESAPGGDSPTDWPQGLAQPCAWASAHMAVPPRFAGVVKSVPFVAAGAVSVAQNNTHMPSRAARVLLMAPMRAPPA